MGLKDEIIGIAFGPALAARLRERRAQTHLSVNELVRQAVEIYLELEPDDAAEAIADLRKGSAR